MYRRTPNNNDNTQNSSEQYGANSRRDHNRTNTNVDLSVVSIGGVAIGGGNYENITFNGRNVTIDGETVTSENCRNGNYGRDIRVASSPNERVSISSGSTFRNENDVSSFVNDILAECNLRGSDGYNDSSSRANRTSRDSRTSHRTDAPRTNNGGTQSGRRFPSTTINGITIGGLATVGRVSRDRSDFLSNTLAAYDQRGSGSSDYPSSHANRTAHHSDVTRDDDGFSKVKKRKTNGSFKIRDWEGHSLSLHTDNGSITANNLSLSENGELELNTENGKIDVNSIYTPGEAHLTATNGKITLNGVSYTARSGLYLQSFNGKIVAKNIKDTPEIECNSQNGSVKLDISTCPKNVEVTTSNGSITVCVPKKYSGRFQVIAPKGRAHVQDMSGTAQFDDCEDEKLGWIGNKNGPGFIKLVANNAGATLVFKD